MTGVQTCALPIWFSAYLKKKPEFISSRFEGKYVVSKTSSKVTPVINWETLEKEDSELANGIRDTEISYKLNDKKLNKWIDENPDTMAKLNRHITEGKPTQRIVVSRADDGEPDTVEWRLFCLAHQIVAKENLQILLRENIQTFLYPQIQKMS